QPRQIGGPRAQIEQLGIFAAGGRDLHLRNDDPGQRSSGGEALQRHARGEAEIVARDRPQHVVGRGLQSIELHLQGASEGLRSARTRASRPADANARAREGLVGASPPAAGESSRACTTGAVTWKANLAPVAANLRPCSSLSRGESSRKKLPAGSGWSGVRVSV